MNLKVLVIGLGSMGKRRIRNLRSLKISNIFGYDNKEETRRAVASEYKINVIEDLKNLSKYNFDFAVISTPPQHHLSPINDCIKNKIDFFSEINLITKDAIKISKNVKKNNILGIPSNTEFFDSDVLKLGKAIGDNFKGYFVYQLGQNIHDWHPWQKIDDYFISKPETNGIREILRIELPWLLKIFGEVDAIQSQSTSFYTKKYGVNDFSCIQLDFVSGSKGILLFDLVSPVVIKRFTATCENRVVYWDERKNLIEIYQGSSGDVKRLFLKDKSVLNNYKFPEDAHLAEIKKVLDIIKKKHRVDYSFTDECKLLRLIDKIEKIASVNKLQKI